MEHKEQRQREEGFYHVNFNGRWTIGEYCEGDKWYILPYGEFMITADFDEIDENRIERGIELPKATQSGEKWKLVNPEFDNKKNELDADFVRSRWSDSMAKIMDEMHLFEGFITSNKLRETQDFENRIVRQEPKTGWSETIAGLPGETVKVNR